MPHLINGNLFYDIKETDGLIPEEAVGVASYAQLVSDDFPSAPTLGDSLYVAIVNASFSNVLPSGTSVGPSTIVRCVKGGNLICIGLLVGKDITQQLYRVIVLSVITLTDSDGDNGSSNLSNYHSGGTWYSLDDTTTGITHGVFESPSSQMLSLISSYGDYNGSIFTQSNITNKQGYSTNNKLITTNDEDISITDVSVNDVFGVIGNDVVYQCKLISQDDSDGSDDVYFAGAPISDNIDPPQPTEVE